MPLDGDAHTLGDSGGRFVSFIKIYNRKCLINSVELRYWHNSIAVVFAGCWHDAVDGRWPIVADGLLG